MIILFNVAFSSFLFILYKSLPLTFSSLYKMVQCRSWSEFTCSNPNYLGVFISLPVIYLAFLFEFALRDQSKELSLLSIFVTIFFLLSFWSYLAVVWSNPGKVPRYWPLYNKDPNERKFCLICHNFKPQRSHHCSRCKQCVLNMDHHCPWINNCVGFSNRKFFILFLTYLVLTILLALVIIAIFEVEEIKQLIQGTKSFDWHACIRFGVALFCIGLIIPLVLFWHMHVKMVFENTTTLEMMVRERRIKSASGQGEQPILEQNPYDIASQYNFTQVFGENILYWPIPLHQDYPLKGKGIFWEKKANAEAITVKDNIKE